MSERTAVRLLSQREVCELLSVSLKTLQSLRSKRKIGFVRLGHRTIRYRPDHVEGFLRRRESAVAFAQNSLQQLPNGF